jgi:hypothetical protein
LNPYQKTPAPIRLKIPENIYSFAPAIMKSFAYLVFKHIALGPSAHHKNANPGTQIQIRTLRKIFIFKALTFPNAD